MIRLAGFALLAAFACHHWLALVADPPLAAGAAMIGLALALAAALSALRAVARPALRAAGGGALVLGALAGGTVLAGLPPALLAPGSWPELRAELAGGLAGVSQVALPYQGGDEWTRTGILLAAPLALCAAVALAYWPTTAAPRPRWVAALAVLVALYGFAVTWEAPGAELGRGVVLLALLALCLWPDGLGRRRAAAAAAVLAAGAAAAAATAGAAPDEPPVDYRSWALFGAEREVEFDWDHSYGPLRWPQRGTTLLEVRAERPLLWRTAVLDTFDGHRWIRAPLAGRAVPARLAGAGERLVSRNRGRGWSHFPGIRLRALSSEIVIGAGTTRAVTGVEDYTLEPDGIAIAKPGLREGDSYSVEAYVPDPGARRLRRADGRYPPALARYTALTLPYGWQSRGPAAPSETLTPVQVPLRGDRQATGDDDVRAIVAGTPYERVLRLARRLTRGAATSYDAATAIASHLESAYRYEQEVPERRDPLPAFLFLDRSGYCQQFSGAMALMLRMVGIPSRVASGFAPGYRSPGGDVFEVRDTDAHSWVEVWFRGVGWVAFDPTPGAAPAQSQSLAALGGRGRIGRFGAGRALSLERAAEGGLAPALARRRGGDGPGPAGAALALLALGGALAGVRAELRRRRLARPEAARLQVAELAAALPRLGFRLSPAPTLLEIERLLARTAGPRAARYAARLRANRYAPGRPRRPGPADRRALRRALARAAGRPGAVRWRAWRALPPGGPRAHPTGERR